jgi:serine/threonine protein kinase
MQSPTLTAAHGTQLGMILGTAAYMAPEQARGKAVDKRADIWAFGVVLFEMLTGRRLFRGETATEIVAAVLKDDIALDSLPPDVPPAIRRLLALAQLRWQLIGIAGAAAGPIQWRTSATASRADESGSSSIPTSTGTAAPAAGPMDWRALRTEL